MNARGNRYYLPCFSRTYCGHFGGCRIGCTRPIRVVGVNNGDICASISSEQGVKQGDGLGSLLFSLSVQDLYTKVTRNAQNVKCVAVADDLNLVGPVRDVLRVFDGLAKNISGTGLRLRAAKCGLLWPHNVRIPDDVSEGTSARSLRIFKGFMVTLGAPVGEDRTGINEWLQERVETHSRFFKLLLRPDMPVQVAFLLLRLCMIPCMGYLARVVSPRILDSHATAFDNTVMRTASEKLGLPLAPNHVALLPLTLPIRLGGFGLRSVRLVSPAAYWASLARAAPFILKFVPSPDRLIRGELKAAIVDDISSCHQALCSLIRKAPREIVPPDPLNLWSTYGQGTVSRKLQKALTVLIDDGVAAGYNGTRNTKADKQRMTSCSANNAGAWIIAIPRSPAVTLSDRDYRYAARHRLGLRPHDDMPRICTCNELLEHDPAHFHSCHRLMPCAITARHDAIVQVLAGMFRRVGDVRVEVKCAGETRLRPDLEIILPDRALLVDVAMVHPASLGRRVITPLAAAGY